MVIKMLCYRDKCYCMASNEKFAKDMGIKTCTNTKCNSHCAEIPFDQLPEWLGIAYTDYHERCGEYERNQ